MEPMLNVEKIRAYMARQQPKAHPILGHRLAGLEDYVRKQYVDMLCVFAWYENRGMGTAGNFVARMMAGAGMPEPVNEHIRNAMALTVEKFEEFLRLCKENKLERVFFLDAILLSSAGGTPGQKQLELLAEVAETLRLNKEQVQKLGRLAAVILTQSRKGYDKLFRGATISVYEEWLLPAGCYLEDLVPTALVDTEDTLWLYSPQRAKVDLTAYFGGGVEEIWGKTVILQNIELDAPEICYCTFPNAETVKMKDCLVRNWGFRFWEATDIWLERCEFTMEQDADEGMDGLFDVDCCDCTEVRIDSCNFHDIRTKKLAANNALFSIYDTTNFFMRRSVLKNITKGGGGRCGNVILDDGYVYLEDCQFVHCRGGSNEDLFYHCGIKKNRGCTFEDCAPLQ